MKKMLFSFGFLVLILFPIMSRGMPLTSRELAMGDCRPWDQDAGQLSNPSAKMVAQTSLWAAPIPLGLVMIPSSDALDPNSSDFSLSRILDTLTPFPFHLGVAESAPPEVETIDLYLFKDSLNIRMPGAYSWVGSEVEIRDVTLSPSIEWTMLGLEFRSEIVSILNISSQHHDVVQWLEGVKPDTNKVLNGYFQAEHKLGIMIGPSVGRAIVDSDDWNVATAFRPKLFFGLSRLTAAGSYAIFPEYEQGNQESSFSLSSTFVQSYLGYPKFSPGIGVSIDCGMSVQKEIGNVPITMGFGIQDFGSTVHWTGSTERVFYDEEEVEVVSEKGSNISEWSSLPRQWTLTCFAMPLAHINALPQWIHPLFIMVESQWVESSFVPKLGFELPVSFVIGRAGLRFEDQILPSIGLGVPLGPVVVDLGLSVRGKSPFYTSSTVIGLSISQNRKGG